MRKEALETMIKYIDCTIKTHYQDELTEWYIGIFWKKGESIWSAGG